MSAAVKTYMRLVADWLIDDLDESESAELDERKDAAWERLSAAEKEEANQLVVDIFGEWL